MDRRVPIFVVFALVCVALVPLADASHRWVAWATAGAYVVLALLVALDSLSRRWAGRSPSHLRAPRDASR